jgi:hypothetical protein
MVFSYIKCWLFLVGHALILSSVVASTSMQLLYQLIFFFHYSNQCLRAIALRAGHAQRLLLVHATGPARADKIRKGTTTRLTDVNHCAFVF